MNRILDFFYKKNISEKKLHLISKEIDAEYQIINNLSCDELRKKSNDLRAIVGEELSYINQEISNIEDKINRGNSDILETTIAYNEKEKKEKERTERCELVLKKYIAVAYAILKSTCFKFANSEFVIVNATENDRIIAKRNKYVSIENNLAIYNTSWIVGGKFIKWNMTPFDNQILGGIVLQYGEILDMLNGEGKTLASTFFLFLNGIAKRKMHVCTANYFLAIRDCEWMRPILEFHGITIDEIESSPSSSEKRRIAYKADIVYGTANEFGFDYLRDNIVHSLDKIVQSELDIVLVDEIDSVLIDDARTPLTISGTSERNFAMHPQFKLLNPFVALLVERQQMLLDDYLTKVVDLFKTNEIERAFVELALIKHVSPKNKLMLNFLNTTPKAMSYLKKFEPIFEEKRSNGEFDNRFFYAERGNDIELNEKGKEFIAGASGIANFWHIPDIEMELKLIEKEKLGLLEQINRKKEAIENFEVIQERHDIILKLIKAYTLFKRDRDYVVMNNEVIIIDDNTGRLLYSRKYSEGLHQAIEAKEGVFISELTESCATISLQSYFQRYKKLVGMTATAITDEREYEAVYNKSIFVIPPSKPTIRKDMDDLVYKQKREKVNAVVNEIIDLIQKGRPVLIGTTSVEDSELISDHLKLKRIPHKLLNAKEHQSESMIIAEAGLQGSVTIAALMAGRGTDIKLSPESINAGGLAVLGFERHESRRLDHQLKGRAGRQGDPGTSQFFVSLEDDLMRMFGSERIAKVMEFAGYQEGEVIQSNIITKSIERAQKKVEENNLRQRSRLYEYDSSLHIAREAIYQKRNHALLGRRLTLDVMNMFHDVCSIIVGITNKKAYNEFLIYIFDTFNYSSKISADEFTQLPFQNLVDKLYYEAYNNYSTITKEIMQEIYPIMCNIREQQPSSIENVVIPFACKIEKYDILVRLDEAISSFGQEVIKKMEGGIIINIIDKHWKRFLKVYDKIKANVSILTSFEKGDPIFLFKKDISGYYNELLEEIHYEIITNLCFAKIPRATSTE